VKIDRDEEQAAIQWLNRHGEAPGVVGLHAWVSGLDAGTRKALGQYLRLRRHRLHAPKVALEITADVHAALSDYVFKEGSASLSEAIGRLLCASHRAAGQSGPSAEIEALREALVARDKEMANLRRRLEALQPAAPRAATRGKRKKPLLLAVAPPCPLCSGEMRPEVANGSRLWVCMTQRGCTGTRDLDEDLALSAELIGADLALAWRHAKGNEAAKAASVVKRTVAALERAMQEHARYWSAGEVASFRAAAAALGKVASACERTT
jgi:hypothetical protein